MPCDILEYVYSRYLFQVTFRSFRSGKSSNKSSTFEGLFCEVIVANDFPMKIKMIHNMLSSDIVNPCGGQLGLHGEFRSILYERVFFHI